MKSSNAWISLLLVIVAVGMTVVSCGSKDFKPVNLVQGDKCDFCQMTIKNQVFASEVVAPGGKIYKFDDFKCLESFLQKPDSPRPEAIFVKDYDTRVWIPYESSTIVRTSIVTPNRSGKVAFKDSVRAREFALKNSPL